MTSAAGLWEVRGRLLKNIAPLSLRKASNQNTGGLRQNKRITSSRPCMGLGWGMGIILLERGRRQGNHRTKMKNENLTKAERKKN